MTLVKFQPVLSKAFYPEFRTPGNGRAVFQRPAINILESPEGFTIQVAAPGLTKDAFQIKVEKNVLGISADVAQNTQENGPKYHRQEFNFGTFEQSFRLPDSIDANSIKAGYEHGILNITLAFKPEVKPVVRNVEIA